jgi:hypothetical protein
MGPSIQISGIIGGSSYESLNGGIFAISINDGSTTLDSNNFFIYSYNPITNQFDGIVPTTLTTYIGGGQISIRDNIDIVSKKFNFLDQGQNIQMGFLDILFDNTSNGAITLNVYLDYNDNDPINQYPENVLGDSEKPDTFLILL